MSIMNIETGKTGSMHRRVGVNRMFVGNLDGKRPF
jgi:hypothetical protein